MRCFLIHFALVGFALPARADLLPYTQLLESRPIEAGGLEFVAIAEAQWVAFNPPVGRDPIQVQLRITNRSDHDLIFPTFDTFGITLADTDGREIKMDGGRNGTLRGTKSVLIAPGHSYSLCRTAELRWNDDGQTRTFVYQDGTGSSFFYGPLSTGRYNLKFWVRNSEEAAARQQKAMGDHVVWSGEAVTDTVSFDVVEPITVAQSGPKLSAGDAASGISVAVKIDERSLIATDARGATLWETDVISAAGAPGVGRPAVRHLSLQDGKVTAVYGKHSYADFDLKTGQLLSAGSD